MAFGEIAICRPHETHITRPPHLMGSRSLAAVPFLTTVRREFKIYCLVQEISNTALDLGQLVRAELFYGKASNLPQSFS